MDWHRFDIKKKKDTMKHAELTEEIIAAFYEVYNEMGRGFLESVLIREYPWQEERPT